MARNATSDDANDDEQTRTTVINLVRDYHMDPDDVADEADAIETLFYPEGGLDELPYRLLERLEMNYLYGDEEMSPDEDDYPEVGESVAYGVAEWVPGPSPTLVSFQPVDD